MRILMVSDVYFPRINGVSTAILTLRRELRRSGHEVTLIAPDYGACGESGDLGPLYRIRSRVVWCDPEDRMMSWRSLHHLTPELVGTGFDLVHVHTPFLAHYAGRRLARRLGVPLVETYHTFFEEYLFHYLPVAPRSLMRWVALAFSRSQCGEADGIVVPSSAILARLRAYGVTTPAAVIPTGIEPADFTQGDGARFRARHGIDPKRPLLLYVGRVAHEKNIGFLLDMLARLRARHPDVLLVIAGEGPAQASLERQAASLGLTAHVCFVGYLDRRSTLLDCYRAADLFVFASRTETQGLVLLEAMAMGLPVVALAVMGTADVLQEGQGTRIARDDPDDFADRVAALLENAPERQRLAAAGREYVRQWTAAETTARLMGFYEEIRLNRRPAQAHAEAEGFLSQTDCRAEAAGRAASRR